MENLQSDPKAPQLLIERVREDFPALSQSVHGKPLTWLDSAATSQKPEAVLAALDHYYRTDNANVHRGVHALSERSTAAYERSRKIAARFLNAPDPRGIIFVRGTTEAVNLVANSWLRPRLKAGDEVLLSHMEHHSNIIPWQLVCESAGAKLVVADVREDGSLDLEDWHAKLSDRTAMVAICHISNALGTVNPIADLIAAAHERGVKVLVDGAQAGAHLPVDIQELDADFYTLSGHKMCGPTGIGVLWGKPDLLDAMPPWQGGGDMISTVSFEKSRWNEIPHKFEAGTPHIAGVIGLGVAMEYLEGLGLERIAAHEDSLLEYMQQRLGEIEGLRLIGTAPGKVAVASFVLDGVHPHDIATILDREGVAVRAGHHCAQPLMQRFGVPATVRVSLCLYNHRRDVDALIEGLQIVQEIFSS